MSGPPFTHRLFCRRGMVVQWRPKGPGDDVIKNVASEIRDPAICKSSNHWFNKDS